LHHPISRSTQRIAAKLWECLGHLVDNLSLKGISPKHSQSRGIANLSTKPQELELQRKPPKSSPLTHGFGRGITAQRTTKGSHKFPPSNPQEQGPENTLRKSPRESTENHHQEQPGTTHPNLEEPRRIIYTCHKGSYKV
jgi:hypothetical protein